MADNLENSVYRRVKFYSATDLANGFFVDRIEQLLSELPVASVSAEDAVELYETWRLIDSGFRVSNWNDDTYSELVSASRRAKGESFRSIKAFACDKTACDISAEVSLDYLEPLWRLLADAGILDLFAGSQVDELLKAYPQLIRAFLEYAKLTKAYETSLLKAMMSNPSRSIAIALEATVLRVTDARPSLPLGFKGKVADELANEFIALDNPNLNYLSVLSNKRTGSALGLSPKTMLKAKRRYGKEAELLFSDGAQGQRFRIMVSIDSDQVVCKKYSGDAANTSISYSEKWLLNSLDYASILNNLIYIMDLQDRRGFIVGAKPNRYHSLDEILGTHYEGEYPAYTAFLHIQRLRLLSIQSYRLFLRSNGVRIEDALEWFFSTYIAEEYGVSGFALNLPGEEESFLGKCERIGIQIERILKAYSIYVRDKLIDPDLFEYETLPPFERIGSQHEKRYAVPVDSEEYRRAVYCLFSNQCMLSYSREHKWQASCFFEAIVNNLVLRSDFERYQEADLVFLQQKGLICERDDSSICVTPRSIVLEHIWRDGALDYCRTNDQEKELLAKMADEGFVKIVSTLFTPPEADYYSFSLKDDKFPNALALRNWYAHGSDLDPDPNASVHRSNYLILLELLIDVVLKINDEFLLTLDVGQEIDWIDWPYEDYSDLDV